MGDPVKGIGEEERVCLNIPLTVSSPGLLGVQGSNDLLSAFLHFSTTRLLLQIFIFVLASTLLCRITKRCELPPIFWQIIVGLLLGNIQVVSDVLFGSNSEPAVQNSTVKVLGSFTYLGYLFFLFLEGVKMDVGLVRKVGWRAITLAILTSVVPLFAVAIVYGRGIDYNKTSDPFFWTTYSLSSFPVIHCFLTNLGLLNSELGRFGLSAALVNDLFTHSILIIFGFLDPRNEPTLETVIMSFVKTLLFIACLFLFRYVAKWVISCRPRGAPVRVELFYTVVVLFLIAPNCAKFCNLFEFTGAFLLGLAVPEGMPLGSALVDKFDPVVSGLFLPLFTVTCALRVDMGPVITMWGNQLTLDHLWEVLLALCTKFLLTILLLYLYKMTWADCFALTFILNTKGVVELAIYASADDLMIMEEDRYVILGIIIIVFATITPTIVKKLYDPSRKYMTYKTRNLMHNRPNEELRILACIDSPAHVVSTINLLDASSPSPNSPMAIDVIHLVELRGRATPIFIAHEKNRSNIVISNSSYSNSLIMAFNNFLTENSTAVNINVYTTVSPVTLMHEDICYLALDRLTSLIILPFHRRRSPDGSIESENSNIRNINCRILDRSPCSVGILVDGTRPKQHVLKMGMIFIGGNDDREALTFAIRSAQQNKRGVELSIVHLIAAESDQTVLDTYDKVSDNEVLNLGKRNEEVRFVEQKVNGGLDTYNFLRSIVNEFDLIIVGRRNHLECSQTSGLEDWNEFSELGVVGDLLASQDINARCSLFIVQQQQQHSSSRL